MNIIYASATIQAIAWSIVWRSALNRRALSMPALRWLDAIMLISIGSHFVLAAYDADR